MFYDNPEIVYENPGPPSDYESEDEVELPVFVLPDEYKYRNCFKLDPSIPYLEMNLTAQNGDHTKITRKYGNVNAAENIIIEDSKEVKHSKVVEIVEVKQERKQAEKPENKKSDYRCDICNIELNGPLHYHSHMTGKKHKKAEILLLEMYALKSAKPVVMDLKTFPKQPGRERVQLYDKEAKMQGACSASPFLILGLDNVVEIRGYEEVKYFCDLCRATCTILTLVSHLVGYRHLRSCLKKYYPKTYIALKNKRDRRADREVKVKLTEAQRIFGRGKIRVFRDVMKCPVLPEPFDPSKPSTSRQGLEAQPQRFVQTFGMEDEPKATDAQFLMKDFGSFFCKICIASMENLSIWEEHVRGKRHAKNKKTALEEPRRKKMKIL